MVVRLDDGQDPPDMSGQGVNLKWWNRRTGDAYVCWKDEPDYCGNVTQFFLSCYDWSESRVPDDIPKLPWADGPFTPNGTVTMELPDGTGVMPGYVRLSTLYRRID